MLVAEARYLGSIMAISAAILVPFVGSVAVARAAHLSYWAAAALFVVMICGGVYTASLLWLRSLRNRNPTEAAKPAAPPARYAPIIVSLVVFLLQAYWITTSFLTFQDSRWTYGGDFFSLACIMTASSAYFTFRGWRSTVAARSGTTPLPQKQRKRLAEFSAAYAQPTKAARSAALRPLRVRGSIRLGLVLFEVALLLSLAPRIGISLALLSSFTLAAVIFLIGYTFFDL